ncbi:GNAT family N-acetyltransferase, partial [Mesorhizobium sp. M00.F.Ca.ET.158.01.1.1]
PDLLIATLELEGRPAFAVALEVVKRGPLRVAQFMGGRHANGNFAAAEPQWLASGDITAIRSMLAAIAGSRPDIDLIALERLLPDLDGIANPLASLDHFARPNPSFALD